MIDRLRKIGTWIKKQFKKILIALGIIGVVLVVGVAPPSITDLIEGKTGLERANIKSAEIVRIFKNEIFVERGYKIEVKDISKIDGGIQYYARVSKGGVKWGFGKDGSVEWERFRVYNPPVLVHDPNGEIARESVDSITGEVRSYRLREAPIEALKEDLAHTIGLIAKNIRPTDGKIGNTTSTFYPDAGTGGTTVDGFVRRVLGAGAGQIWSTIRSAAGNASEDTITDSYFVTFRGDTQSNRWISIARFILLFDTSAVSPDTVDSATLSLYGSAKTDPLSATPDINIVSSTPTSDNDLVNGDYNKLGTTLFSTAITYSSFSISAYNDFALNASGISNINTSGISKFGAINENYDFDNVVPSWSSLAESFLIGFHADEAGTSKDPKLIVEHAGAVRRIIMVQ